MDTLEVRTDRREQLVDITSDVELRIAAAGFSIDYSPPRSQLLDIVEGGMRSFQKRATKYRRLLD